MDNTQWWFHLDTIRHKIEFGCWVSRYAFTFIIFILGIKAPGISSVREYYTRYSEEALVNNEDGNDQNASTGSTWRNVGEKLMLLLPYLWPKRSPMLQMRVLACILMLVCVRVTNVFVPILSKKIVDALAGVKHDGVPIFAWQLIIIFVTLKMLQGGGTGSQGLLNGFRSFLWIRVQQFTTREIQVH